MDYVDKLTKIVRSFLCRSVMMCGAWKCGYSVWKPSKNRMNLGLCTTAASVATGWHVMTGRAAMVAMVTAMAVTACMTRRAGTAATATAMVAMTTTTAMAAMPW